MPTLKMRRSTRVFVPKKDGDGVRVLRSGRRVQVKSGESDVAKIGVSVEGLDGDGDDLFRMIEDSDQEDKVGKGMELDDAVVLGVGVDEKAERQLSFLDKRFGVVYSRKRKRCDLKGESSYSDRKFGLHFSRRQRRNIVYDDSPLYLSVGNSSFRDRSCGFAGVLSTVLRYMWTAKLGLVELSQSQLVHSILSSCDVHFLRKYSCNKSYGLCKIYGDREFIPLFDISFTSVPLYFVHLHASMWFRSMRLSSLLLTSKTDHQEENDLDDDATYVSCQNSSFSHVISKVEDLRAIHIPFGVSRSTNRVAPHRNGVTTRGCHRKSVTTGSRISVVTRSCSRNGVSTRGCCKRRKRSPRARRARNPSLFGVHRGCGSSVLEFGIGRSAVESTSALPYHVDSKLVRSNSSTGDMKLVKSSLTALGKDIETVSCSANILVVGSDRCYRESGACVTLELSTSNEWLLAIRIDGLLRCYHRAEKDKEVKPNSTNRFTFAIVWCVEPGWKLEFTDRTDWAIFKELFRVCGDRNIDSPCPAKAIPIPGICEVSVSHISHNASYCRPESYIKLKDDELSRALLKKTANYDMDLEDEEWLNTFNTGLEGAKTDVYDRVTNENFEMIIDAFEKAVFCRQCDLTDDVAPADLHVDLARREVIEAAYSYWKNKRTQKGTPLLRVFQLNEPKTPFIVKPVLRKKRSMKQRNTAKTTPSGRGKQLCVLQAMAAEQNVIEEKSAMVEVDEARGVAKSAMEIAVEKRRRAQTLMESADLAMYRAAMAIRIAEASRVAERDLAVAYFLDGEEGQTEIATV